MVIRLLSGALILSILASAQPSRVVSTSPSITEILFALGAGQKVVGVSEYCRYPEEVTRLPKVGTFLRPNAEQIARLQPDLVILQKQSTDIAARLSALGIPYIEVQRGSLPHFYTMVQTIGGAIGVGARARELIANTQQQLTLIGERSAALRRPTVLFVVGRQVGTLTNLVAAGSDSYLNELVEIAGGHNVLSGGSLPAYPRISMETVVRLNPDILLDVADPMVGLRQPAERQQAVAALWGQQTQLSAVRQGRVRALDSEAFVVPGPRVSEVAQRLFEIFHPGGK